MRDNTRFNERLERILSAKVEQKKAEITKKTHANWRFLAIPVHVAVMFFVLKAAALTQLGTPFAPTPTSDTTLSTRIYHWFAGADPITRALSSAMSPVMADGPSATANLAPAGITPAMDRTGAAVSDLAKT